MNKIYFTDGVKLCVAEGEKVETRDSEFYLKYIEGKEALKRSSSWKQNDSAAIFRGDYNPYEKDAPVHVSFGSVEGGAVDGSALYSVSVDNVSAIMEKDFNAEKDSEKHIIHDVDKVFDGASYNRGKTKIVTSIKSDPFTGHIAVFDVRTNDLTTYTVGDSCDSDAAFSSESDDVIFFSTRGVARNNDGEFVRYSPSSLCSLDLRTMEINEIRAGGEFGYFHPHDDGKGDLYCVKRPSENRKKGLGRLLLDIILIPYKLVKAIYYFLESFTLAFTGETFTHKNPDSVKKDKKSAREIMIEGNKINAEREYKAGLRRKDEFAGIAPASWTLVKISDGKETTLVKGVINYAVSDGEIIYTNGRNVVALDLETGKKTKIASASLCTKVGV